MVLPNERKEVVAMSPLLLGIIYLTITVLAFFKIKDVYDSLLVCLISGSLTFVCFLCWLFGL